MKLNGLPTMNSDTHHLVHKLRNVVFLLPTIRMQVNRLPTGAHKTLLRTILTQWMKLAEENEQHAAPVHYLYASLVMVDLLLHVIEHLHTSSKLTSGESRVLDALACAIESSIV